MSSTALIKSKALKDIVQTDNVKNRLKEIMGERAPQFAAALVQIVNGSYQLQQCDPNSILGAAITAAALDLSCDPNLGEAHLVPYSDKCQFQIGYRGFIQLAMRSGQYKAIGSTEWDKNEKKADQCTSCGQCETKCPQKIAIRKQLKQAHDELSK